MARNRTKARTRARLEDARGYVPEIHDEDSVFFRDTYTGPSERELMGGCNRCGGMDDCYCEEYPEPMEGTIPAWFTLDVTLTNGHKFSTDSMQDWRRWGYKFARSWRKTIAELRDDNTGTGFASIVLTRWAYYRGMPVKMAELSI